MPTPEVHDDRNHTGSELSEVHFYRRARRRGGHRAGAIVTGVLLFSGVGVGGAYGVAASASSAPARELDLTLANVQVRTVPMRILPVTAPSVVAKRDLDDRVRGLVDQADLIVAAKVEAEHKAAEDAARAARAAQQKAAADPAAGGVKPDGGCLGKHHGT
jgi:hypothetical protein